MVSTAATSPEASVSRAGGAVHRRLRQAAVDHHPGGEARPEVRGPEPEQLPVRVDLVTVAGRIGLRRAQTLGEPDQRHPERPAHDLQIGPGGDRGQPHPRQTRRDRPDHVDPVGVEPEDPDGGDRQCHRDERPGHHRQPSPEPEDDDEGAEPDHRAEQVGAAEMGHEVPELGEEVTVALLDADQLRELAHRDGQGEPDDEALEHGLGDEAREEAETEGAGHDRDEADGDRDRRRQRDRVEAPAPEVGHDAGGQRGGRRHRPDDEVPRAADQRVEHQGGCSRVEPDDRRHPGDRGVRQRLGDQDRPDRRAGDQVLACPGRPVPAQRRRDHARHRPTPPPDGLRTRVVAEGSGDDDASSGTVIRRVSTHLAPTG